MNNSSFYVISAKKYNIPQTKYCTSGKEIECYVDDEYTGCLLIFDDACPEYYGMLKYFENYNDQIYNYTITEYDLTEITNDKGKLEYIYQNIHCPAGDITNDKDYFKMDSYPDKSLKDIFYYTILEISARNLLKKAYLSDSVYDVAQRYFVKNNNHQDIRDKIKVITEVVVNEFNFPNARKYLKQKNDNDLLLHYYLLLWELCHVFGKTDNPVKFWDWLRQV